MVTLLVAAFPVLPAHPECAGRHEGELHAEAVDEALAVAVLDGAGVKIVVAHDGMEDRVERRHRRLPLPALEMLAGRFVLGPGIVDAAVDLLVEPLFLIDHADDDRLDDELLGQAGEGFGELGGVLESGDRRAPRRSWTAGRAVPVQTCCSSRSSTCRRRAPGSDCPGASGRA